MQKMDLSFCGNLRIIQERKMQLISTLNISVFLTFSHRKKKKKKSNTQKPLLLVLHNSIGFMCNFVEKLPRLVTVF